MTLNNRASLRRRATLMGSTAFLLAAFAAPASAQDVSLARPGAEDLGTLRITDTVEIRDSDRPIFEAIETPHTLGSSSVLPGGFDVGRAQASIGDYTFASTVRIDPTQVQDDPSITINNNFNGTTGAYDPTNVTGIGQVIVDSGGGFIGTCTGTLVNRRTIIFAAHCVNTRAATAYGANTGGVGIGIGFETNTRANAAGQTDELVRWLLGTGPNAEGRFQSNTAQQFYNARQVFYNPGSLAPASCTTPTSCFLEADIAVATLDRPAINVPTWTMLFSALPAPTSISPTNGTGYHVTIAGYGAYGNGTTGAATSGNFRRRIAENMLGGLASIDQRNLFLFGTQGNPARPQLLYWLDFDDPARGTATANTRDFNGFRDNALPREGLTGPGDSGGPLIIDQAFGQNVNTIIGVLSGGSTFFTGQQGGSYGTQSFYQPLFLYWDWIVANNPYRYVTALAGNRNWEDGSTWLTELDPAYRIVGANGQLINGLPTNLGGGITISDPRFGELCFQSPNTSNNPASNECEDIRTGQPRNNVPNTQAGDSSSPAELQVAVDGSQPATLTTGGTETAIAGRGDLDGSFETPSVDYSATPRPAPTIANGLPGATNFVANNVDGDRVTGTLGRYYDVTLRNAGILSLSSNVTIDNFTISGAQSQLTINTAGTLNSLVEINHLTGIMNVNGTLNSAGDYFFMSGLLTGTGRINAPFLTSVMGNFAPGTVGTIGTLTIGGNLVMASGSTYALDIGANGTSDRIAVVAGSGQTGSANVGGRVLVSTQPVTRGNVGTYTILTAQGGVTGTFAPNAGTAILQQNFIYSANAVQLQIQALPFTTVVNTSNANRFAFARLLDQNTGVASLAGLYNVLDQVALASTLNSVLDGLAPTTEPLRTNMGVTAVDNIARVIRDRQVDLTPGDLGGRVAYYGRRVETAALAVAGLSTANATMSDVSVQPAEAESARLPETMSAFLSVGYLDGSSQGQLGSQLVAGQFSAPRDSFDGFYGAAGVEMEMGNSGVVGVAVSYTSIDGDTALNGGQVDGSLIQGSVYGKFGMGRFYVDGALHAGQLDLDVTRTASLPGQTINLVSDENAWAFGGELGVGTWFRHGNGVQIGPRASIRYSQINFDDITETGGVTALAIQRDEYKSIQARAGLIFNMDTGPLRPHFTANYVHDFEDRPTAFAANFVGGAGAPVLFGLTSSDQDWGELSGGITYERGNISIGISADTTVARDDVSNQSYRATLKFRF